MCLDVHRRMTLCESFIIVGRSHNECEFIFGDNGFNVKLSTSNIFESCDFFFLVVLVTEFYRFCLELIFIKFIESTEMCTLSFTKS